MSDPLIRVLKEPSSAPQLSTSEWADLLPRLKYAGLLAHLGERMAAQGVVDDNLPAAVQRQLAATASAAWVQARSVRWECGELQRIFANTGIPLVLLKGAGYVMTQSLPGRGRFLDDMDVLVPYSAIPEVTRRLEEHGWVNTTANEEDAAYFDEWLHQVPAFRHTVRNGVLDVHHTVIAPWGGHQVAVEQLFAHAVRLDDSPLSVPSALDQCLIVAAHFIRSDANARAFRDLLDLDALMAVAAPDAAGLARLEARAKVVGLERALGTASHYAGALFGTPTSGPKPLGVGIRARAMIPLATRRRSKLTAVLRELHHVEALRAGLTWRIMFERTIRRRMKRQ